MKVMSIAICFVAALFVFPSATQAQFLVVDCSGLNPSAFPTINSALPLVAGPGAFILVTGPCNENVSLNGVNDLAIAALFGQTANINGNLSINNSHNVFLGGLNIANSFGDGITKNQRWGSIAPFSKLSGIRTWRVTARWLLIAAAQEERCFSLFSVRLRIRP
jgi:hypothetical protein